MRGMLGRVWIQYLGTATHLLHLESAARLIEMRV